MTPLTTEHRDPGIREAHLRDYWKIAWQARWTILATFFLVVGLTAVWTFLQTKIYQATAVIEVQPQANRLAAGQDVSGLGVAGYGWFAEEKYHNTQVEILQSRDVARRVVDVLGLRTHPQFADSADPIESFRRLVRAIPRRDTGLIEVSMTGPNPDDVARWVNEVARTYVARNLEKAQEKVHTAIDTIEHQMTELTLRFRTAEEERFENLQRSSLGSEEQGAIVVEQLKTYNAELTRLDIELNRLRDSLDQIGSLRANQGDLMSVPELAEDPVLKELHTNKTKLDQELKARRVELGPSHPKYEEKREELASVSQKIQERVSNMVGTLQNRADRAEAQREYLRRQISLAESDSLRVAKATSEYDLVKTESETTKRIFDLIQKTVNEVQLGAQLMTNNVAILDEAETPNYPVKPRRKLNLMIGGVMGLLLGLAAAFFLDYLDNTLRTPDDVEQRLGLAVLGIVPRIAQQGLSGRAAKEAYQSLRTSVIFSSKNRRRKVILVTSTGPQEGKSSTAIHLGRTMAAAGDRVVLVDCDLRRPSQHVLSKLDRDNGVTNYLSAPLEGPAADWRGYTKTVEGSGLQVITSGPIPPSPPELLGSERFAELIAALREVYDWVIVDSPPAATLADATLLASLADMIVLVVRHARTDRDLVGKTVQRLRSVNPEIAGVVLNDVDIDRAYNRDYYYAGAYYYTEDADARGSHGKKPRGAKSAGAGG